MARATPDRITVCICTFRRPQLLERLLQAIASQQCDPAFSFDVVVVDNDRERSAEAMVARFRTSGKLDVSYDCEVEQNISLARNRAVTIASGSLIAFIDDDERPVAEWLAQLHRTLCRFGADGVLGPVVPDYPDGVPAWVRNGRFCERRRMRTGTVISAADARTGNVLLSRSLFPPGEIWFDPAYGRTGGEDTDFFARQLRAGHRFVWCDEAPSFEAVSPERWRAAYYIKRHHRSGTQDGERMRAGKLPVENQIARNGLILAACLGLAPVTLFLPKHQRVKILRKLAYCAGVIAGYLALSFSRERDEQHDGPSGQRVVTSADESAASVGKRALHFSIAAAYFALRGVYRAVVGLLGRRRLPKRPVVITYHSIHGPDVPKFEEQMREVKRCATPITAMNLLDQSDDQTVAVTFDDGFSNVFDHAVPILAKHQVPATCFIPTGYIGREAGWMALRPPNGKPFRLESLASAERLAAADPRWITIGSHTVTHPHLTALDDTELDRELVESKGTLEEIVGKDVTSLSFPYGSFSGKVVASAVAAGYAQVFANVPVRAAVGSTPVLVGRIGVSAQDWPWEFRLKVLGAYEWLAVVIPIKRALLQRLRLRLS